jgi:hypothetical protein
VKTLIRLAAAVLAFASAAGAQQTSSPTITMLDGECRALLNGTDIGCPKGAIYSALANGRHMVNFATTDIATIGFAGARLQMTGDASSILWLDGAYINQQRFPADGQCSLEHKPSKGVELTCKAILRDGRKLFGSVTASEQKDVFMGIKPIGQRKADCEGIIKAHGMLTRAQFQCGFEKYSNEMIQDARRCSAMVGDTAAKDLLREGMETFDWNEQKRGHEEMCRSILANFPGLIAK